MVKGKKELTNIKDVLHKYLTLPLITYLQTMLSVLSSLPIPVLRILDIEATIGFTIEITKCMKLHF